MTSKAAETPESGARDAAVGDPALIRLSEIATQLGEAEVAMAVQSLAERVAEGRFYVACIGQFKRGKSTLINALVGHDVLPSGVVPVTSVPTVIRHGFLAARVQHRGGAWTAISLDAVTDYVSEERNPGNAKHVTGVEVFVPSPLLASGMCLVDTPGLGSVNPANTAATRQLVPHIDAALVVLGADPPLSGDELQLLDAAGNGVRDLIFVLNKADRTSAADRAAAAAFTRRMVQARLKREVVAIFEVSAIEQLERRGVERDWRQLAATLERLARESGRALVRAATERGCRHAAEQLTAAAREQRAALERPLADSEARLGRLQATIEEAQRSLQDLGALLTAEQQRLAAAFSDRRNDFFQRARVMARQRLRVRLAALARRRYGPRYRRAAMHTSQEVARTQLLPWLRTEGEFAETAFQASARRFVDLGNDFLHRLAASGLRGLQDLPDDLEGGQGLQAGSRFQFHSIERVAAPASPILFVADLILVGLGRRGTIHADALAFLDQLLEVNSARVQSDVVERVAESRKKLERLIGARLRGATAIAERALARARMAHAAGTPAVEAALAHLREIETDLDAYRSFPPTA